MIVSRNAGVARNITSPNALELMENVIIVMWTMYVMDKTTLEYVVLIVLTGSELRGYVWSI